MTDRTLKAKVSTLQQLQVEIDTLTEQAESLKDAIKAEMTARAVDELEAGNAVIRWKSVNSTRFDSKAFKQAHSRLYEQFAVHTETRRFTVVA